METTLKLDDKLLAEATNYARQAHRSLSEIVAEALQEKLSKRTPKVSTGVEAVPFLPELHPDIRRVAGLASADWDATAIYHEHLAGRHA